MAETPEHRRSSSGEVSVTIEQGTGAGSGRKSSELENGEASGGVGVRAPYGGGSSTGNSESSGFSFSKANALPVEISSTNEKPEPISVPVKLERSKTANILSKEAAMIFDDKTSVHQKLKLLNRIATVKDDGTVEFDVPGDVEPQSFGVGSTAGCTDVAEEPLDATDLQGIPPMQIVMLIVGTRGDVQPFIAIGKRLQDYGHRVRLASHSNFKEFVLTSGLEFYPLGGDPKVLAGCMYQNESSV